MNWYSQLFLVVSWISAFPIMGMTWDRFRNPPVHAKVQLPPGGHTETFVKVAISFYTLYYVCDSYVLSLLLFRSFDICNFSFLTHHVVTLVGLPFAFSFPYYPWFVLGPIGFHCFLIMFPTWSLLNYGYLAFLVFCMLGLKTNPWYQYARYRGLLYSGYVLVAVPIIMLWFFGCSNDMENTDVPLA